MGIPNEIIKVVSTECLCTALLLCMENFKLCLLMEISEQSMHVIGSLQIQINSEVIWEILGVIGIDSITLCFTE